VYFTPYGVGLGHASRLLILANNLKQFGIESRFSSFGEAEKYINLQGYHCVRVPPVEFLWGKEGDFSVKDNISKIPRWITNLPIQINKEIKYLKKVNPAIIISDSRLSSLIAGKILNIPKILLINQIKLLLTPRLRQFSMGRFFETCNGELMGSMWNVSDIILIPDLPPPYTISGETINTVKSIKPKIRYIGFITPSIAPLNNNEEILKTIQIDKGKPLVFVHISGPKETRKPIINKMVEVCKNFTNMQFIFSEGNASGDTNPNRICKNILYYEWCPIKDELFYLSDLIVIRGGHTAISQAIQFGKPIVSIPIDNHGEQLSNSNKIEKLGLGKKLTSKKIDLKSVKMTIEEIINDDKYQKNALKLKEISNRLNGIENVKEIIFSHI
jgi:UDP-N-acetylglucosamine--N-acetylmuramyl-(pentapeptide) pyrophosphoryl-undecaprenol N-acetylglucosamine transferase